MAEHAFDMQSVEVLQAVLNNLKTIPTATVYNAVCFYG